MVSGSDWECRGLRVVLANKPVMVWWDAHMVPSPMSSFMRKEKVVSVVYKYLWPLSAMNIEWTNC